MTSEDRKDPLKSAVTKSYKARTRDMYTGYLTATEILALFKAGATDYYGHKGKRSLCYIGALDRKKKGIGGGWWFSFHPNGIKMRN